MAGLADEYADALPPQRAARSAGGSLPGQHRRRFVARSSGANLGLALLASAIKLLWPGRSSELPPVMPCEQLSVRPAYAYPMLGASLGFLAGVTGIGGGIFLAPALYFFKWGQPQQISGGCAFFILVNSLAGLCGQIIKSVTSELFSDVLPYTFLLLAVLIGGQAGSRCGAGLLKASQIQKLTGALTLYVSLKLLFW